MSKTIANYIFKVTDINYKDCCHFLDNHTSLLVLLD
uniref:Uncharacterized protein n=1 Tax=Ciona intestinalis TaxID=7719 RepID=H2XPK2_CIOIN